MNKSSPIASPFFAKPFGTSESPKGAKNWRRVIAFGAPAVPARLVRTQRGVRTPLADNSTPGRDALCKTYDRRYRVDLRSHTRRSGFRGLLDSLAHSLHVSQRPWAVKRRSRGPVFPIPQAQTSNPPQ
ncbi:protein of unknown function [Methylocaldum szegediense]|uniref:Transposase DDE domain-containing protein n=1 Tax=Methylocaldum szegediense TaxID=73780 RepID=A0ABM9I178_9GAMM|nr:protein of unknown function [Methylocaldum szegediense]